MRAFRVPLAVLCATNGCERGAGEIESGRHVVRLRARADVKNGEAISWKSWRFAFGPQTALTRRGFMVESIGIVRDGKCVREIAEKLRDSQVGEWMGAIIGTIATEISAG